MKVDVLEDTQRGVEIAAKPLWHIGNARTLCDAEHFVGHITVKNPYMALLDNPHARDQRKQSRLADTIRTDHADHATSGNVDRNIVKRNACPIAMRNVLDFGDDAI